MGRSITDRQPDGTVVYKADQHLNVPELDILTMLFNSQWCDAKPNSILHADAEDPLHKHTTVASTIQLIRQLAHALRHTYGIGRDAPDKDVVLVVTSGHYMLPTLFFGTVAARGVYSAASPASTPAELAYLVGLVAPTVVVCSADTRAMVEATARGAGLPAERVLLLGNDGPGLQLTVLGTGNRVGLSPARTLGWERITDLKTLENSVICVLFSSGTTGFPKGVRISHRMMLAEAFLTMEAEKEYLRREKPGVEYRTLAHVPAAHIAGVQSYMVNATYRGGTAYWMPKFDFPKFLEYMKKYKITYFFSVPPIYLAIAKHPGVTDQFDSVEGAASGAAPLGSDLQAAAEAKLGKGGADLTQVWGLSETCGAITIMWPGEGEHTGSVSPLLANHEARIVGDDGKDVEPGGTGEVWVRGPVVFKGYWKNEEANRESFVGDWFCTGDVGYFRNGMLYIVDRKKELIKYKGLQVAPAELEEVLLSHPKIADAAVIGVDGEETEVPRAYVVPAARDLTREEVAKWVEGKVAPYKKLRGGVLFVDAIPKNPSGKILRKVLREEAKRKQASKL
ncbi:unnamed protein product [Discula destructiva]